MTKKKPKKMHKKAGRKSKLTPALRKKIIDSASLGCNQNEMALYCGVTRQTLANYFREDDELLNHVNQLRDKPILKARKTLVKSLDQPPMALEYLKRKRREEFGDKVTMKVEAPKPILHVLLQSGEVPELNERVKTPENTPIEAEKQEDEKTYLA